MQQQSRKQQVYKSMKLSIMNNLYKKWKVFHQYRLTTQFEISRISIRQVLTKLIRGEYVNSYDKSAMFVLYTGLICSNMRKEKERI
ncbi:hypothetical protein LW858_29650 (plasmid) [Bacillus cereus]|uniref:hypothetical protein n=1 Tax=Bacillus cereus TaxID=1396 RepID=UPI001F3CA671|nr:hypothetical protein [Bacillus cereus]UIJ69720.1 hypothetical protein LW858_29650 [Bacillus cereus]